MAPYPEMLPTGCTSCLSCATSRLHIGERGRWHGGRTRQGNSTLVEFWLSEQDDARRRFSEGNMKGWAQRLGILKTHAERVTV